MLKFNNKRDVDRHVTQMTKTLSENERSHRGYAIAKSYVKVSEYETARDWLQRYLDLKSNDASGHKLMGEIYEQLNKPDHAITSYQRAYNLNTKQSDLVKSICRLFLVNDVWTSSPGKAKYWCELADTENIGDDNVLSLRLKMLNKDKKGGGKPVEEMILKEIAGRPKDVGLRIRLVKFLLEEKRITEAFKYCFELEMKFIEVFMLSIDWYTTVYSVLQQHTTTDNWNYWYLLLIAIDRQIYLSLKKDISLHAIKQNNIKEITNLIFEFDQVLKKAADSLTHIAPAKDFAEEIINHFRGQLSLHVAALLFQKQKVSNNDQWRDTTRKCLPFLLFAFQCATVNTESFWLKNTNETIRSLFSYLKKEGSFRCAQAGRTILACKSTGSEVLTFSVRNYKHWKTIDDIFNQVREICVDLNWRKNIYRQLFANADQQTKVSTSYLVQNSFFQEPNFEIISFNDLDNYESIAQYLYPASLEHHVYLGLGRKDLHSYKSHTFNNLNLSASNLINCNPETINRIDIDSFLYCAIIQARRRLEAERDCYESFSNKPNEKPLLLPAANMVDGLCTEEQNDWWLSAHKIYKNISGDNMSQLKATLQFGIEAIRGIDAPKVDSIILLKLGDTLLARAGISEKVDEKRHLELRAEYVYKIAMRMLKLRESDNMRRIFKFVTSNFDTEREIDQLAGAAIGHLSGIYFKREEFQEFIEDFAGIQNPWAHYFCAEAYKKLDESNLPKKKSKKLYAEKVRENLLETLELLKNNDNIEQNNPLRIRVEKDLQKIQYNLSTSFNDELDFKNMSHNGNTDEDSFHNASSTSFRGRRDLSTSVVHTNFNEKFVEVENLIRKVSDLVVSVKEDVLCVRNDITDLKDEVLNIRGDIADLNATTTKSLSDVYKVVEDLTWHVTYMMNLAPNAAAAAAGAMAGRMPVQTPINQMYNPSNTAYPMYPQMQYPTPSMMQRPPPQQGQMPTTPMAYDAIGQGLIMNPQGMMSMQSGAQKSTLMEALNTPSLLNTWNNTYNQQQAPMTPPNYLVQPLPNMSAPVVPPAPTIQAPAQVQMPALTPIQNKPIDRAPPVNVVITSSDPLPPQNTFVSQPAMSVTIPPQHIKHAPQPFFQAPPVVSSTVIRAPQYENISPAKNDTSDYLEEPADYDPRPDFKPIIPLPDEVEVKTGEENEDIIFSERCKLFRFDNEWKERGIGNIKILKNKETGKYRILMRREQIHKLCANHAITPELELKATEKPTNLMWAANDFSDEKYTLEKFLVRFKNVDQTNKFKEAFETAKKLAPKTPTQEKTKEPLKSKDENPKVKPAAPLFGSSAQTTLTAADTTTPKSTFAFGGLTGTLTPSSGLFSTLSSDSKGKEKEAEKGKTAEKPSPFANFSFGQGSSNKSFSELFSGISSTKTDTSTPVASKVASSPTLNKSSHEDEDVDHYEPTAKFEPVIPLPELIDAKTGEEDENVTFVHRAKLLRYDATNKEWKERGIGEMKVLVHRTDPSKARLLMRREQILKLCCNMIVTKDLKFSKMNATTYSFGGQDFSENEPKTETLAIKFKTPDLIEKFLEAVRNAQNGLEAPKEPVKIVNNKKEEPKGFGNLFKPKVGSWDCEACYITNKPDTLYCIACETPKDDTVPKKEAKSALAPSAQALKFSFGMAAAQSNGTTIIPQQKKDEPKGFGNLFKPKVGSWDCEACYISNKPDTLYCVACETPKDDTVPKKGAKSALAPSADAPKFSFGMPAGPGFSFGVPAASTQPSGSFTFASATVTTAPSDAPLTTSSSFSFGSEKPKDSATEASGMLFGAPKSFSFGMDSVLKTDIVPPAALEASASGEGFKFVFKAKSPSKSRSPGKTRNDSMNSEGGESVDADEYHEEENQTYFTPAIALPDKIDVKTGEENEEVLYTHRAKLFRFVDKEWKERGLGDIKILKHTQTGKLRVVMRREQIFKICLNFFLTHDIELKHKDDNSWTFAALDFSEGEVEATSFAIRFKNKEIAESFQKAVEDALAGFSEGVEKQDGEMDEKAQLVKRLQLPETFFDYLNAPECPGCIGCKSDDYVFDVSRLQAAEIDAEPISLESPKVKGRPKNRRQSVDKHVSFKLADEKEISENEKLKQLLGKSNVEEKANIFGGIKKSEGSTNIFASFNSENQPKPTFFGATNTENIFGASKPFGTPTSSIFSSSLNTTPAATTTESVVPFGNKPEEPFGSGLLFSSKSAFGEVKENGDSTNKGFGAFSSTPTFGTAAINSAPAFGGSIFGSIATANKPETTASPATSNIFGSTFSSTFSFADAAKDLSQPQDLSKSSAVVPDFLQKSNASDGFAALAAVSPDKSWATSNTSDAPTGGFFGLTVKHDFFSKNLNKINNPNAADTSQNDENTNDDNYDPHYDPIISLPDEINVSTGEEEEEKMFAERAKLFRYDAKTKEWKERGVGELKILHHAGNGTYRLVLRREQIFKLVLNQLITADFYMSNMNNSPKAFCWAGMNYADASGEAEQLAIRFKNEDLAGSFKKQIDKCVEQLASHLNPEND